MNEQNTSAPEAVEEVKFEEFSKEPQAKAPQKIGTLKMFLIGIVGMVVVAILVGMGLAVNASKNLSENAMVLTVAQVLGLPAAKVNGIKILYVDYIDDMKTLKKFYSQNPVDFPSADNEQMSDQVLSRLIANKLIASIAQKFNVSVSAEDLNKAKTEILAQFDNDEKKAEEELNAKYGWTLDKYLQKVIGPILLEQKLQEKFSTNTEEEGKEFAQEEYNARHILFLVNSDQSDSSAKMQAQKVLDRIKKGEDFASLAKQFGADATKDTGGDLGWFTKGQMVSEFENAVISLEPGQLKKELVKTEFGYHIVKLEGKRTVKNFVAYMDDQLRKADIKVLISARNPFAGMNKAESIPEETATTTK